MRRAARRDVNHHPLYDVFFTLLAGHVTDCSGFGAGMGDLFCSFGNYCCVVEIKRNEKATYTAAQIRFQARHAAVYFRVETEAQAIDLCKYIRKLAEKLA